MSIKKEAKTQGRELPLWPTSILSSGRAACGVIVVFVAESLLPAMVASWSRCGDVVTVVADVTCSCGSGGGGVALWRFLMLWC